jgi:hypothetical protein
MNRCIWAAFALLLGCACITTNQAIRPGGDEATIAFRDGTRCPAELLALTQTDLYFLRNQQVWRSPLAELSGVHVNGYGLRPAKYAVFGLFGAADLALSTYSFLTGCWPFGAITIPFLAGSVFLSRATDPPVDFRVPLGDHARSQLAPYCRYPQGLSDAQWQQLLSFYHQDQFAPPNGAPER